MTDCIRDDSTDCACPRCASNDAAWERDQGWDDYDDVGCEDDDCDEESPLVCCLGDECLNAEPYHTAAECFDLEMARELMGPSEPNADGKR